MDEKHKIDIPDTNSRKLKEKGRKRKLGIRYSKLRDGSTKIPRTQNNAANNLLL
jgi:hypothetical protein